MARQKKYIRDKAISSARDAFREYGFHALGIRSIEDLVGLGRFAIRTDFQGKDGLFKEALALHREERAREVIQPLRDAEDISALEKLLDCAIDPTGNLTSAKFGCLFVNTMVENAALQNAEFKEYTNGHFEDVRKAVIGLIERAKANGSVRADVDAVAAADFIKGSFMAIALLARDAQDVSAATGYVRMVLTAIASWRPDAPENSPLAETN